MPWVIFSRDRAEFEKDFPLWRIERVVPIMPIRYLLSGGVSLRSLAPGWSFGFWRMVEKAMSPLMTKCAMFTCIVLRRVEGRPSDG